MAYLFSQRLPEFADGPSGGRLRRWESESSIWHSAENQVFRAWERRAYVPREETSPFPGSWQPSRSAVVFCVLEAQQ